VRLRATPLLLLALVVTSAGREGGAPDTLCAEARLAFDRGDLRRAIEMAGYGQRRFGRDVKWNELFAIVAADALTKADKPTKALELLARTAASGDPEAAVRRRMARGLALTSTQSPEADAEFARAYRLAQRIMPSLRAEILVRSTGPLFWRDDSAGALQRIAQEALDLTDRAQQPYVFANALGMRAIAFMRGSQYQQAIEHFGPAMRFAQTIGAKGTLSKIIGNFGWSYYQLGDSQQALERFEQALRGAVEQGDLGPQSTWLADIARVHITEQRFDKALPFAERSVAVARKYGEPRRLGRALSNLAQVEIELARFERAQTHNDEALAIFRQTNDGAESRYAQLNGARIEAGTGATERAMQTLGTLVESKDLPLRWHAQAAMARIHRAAGRRDDAERLYSAALTTGDDARVQSNSDDAYLFAFESHLIRFYDEAIALLLESGRVTDALNVAEQSRAQTLRRGIGLPEASGFSAKALARTHNATILWYWLAPSRSILWIISGDEVSVVMLPAAAVLENDIATYRREILAGRGDARSETGRRLFDTLVAPATAKARTTRFIVVPDGALSAINFESLGTPAQPPRYWIEDATVSYTPSLHFLAAASARRSRPDRRLLAMGDVPAQGAQFPELVSAGAEIERIKRHFEPRQSVVATGLDATPAAYLTTDLPRFSYIHFAAHGTANERTPLDSAVILARGRLSGREIVAAPITAELVSVSSCNSAGKRNYAGEGLVGLAWAFLRAGARRVVATQWEVGDAASPDLMDHLYQHLSTGSDPAEALRQAKLDMLRPRHLHSRPFYWAPFILYGAP
jgi:CHAT domain-containing protein/Tfp pilus assembly protein PilF